jgi:putative methionine-R-sulfoxide reductase with GAF domain
MAEADEVGSQVSPRPGEDVGVRLHELEALTDTALAQLDVEALLEELLRRVLTIVDADTAAVLLLDEAANELVATAACGIEEEVRQGVRIPVGRGFAGRIAAQRTPVALHRVDATTVTNPILWEKGIKVMLGVPLMAGDDLIGVLHVGRLHDRPFEAHDEELLAVVAERVAGATQSRRLAVERSAAAQLERSLLPTTLPECDGLEIAAQQVTREDRIVGGDWYDMFTVPSGVLWVVAGDVAGHGLPAAVIMGRTRTAVRAYALLGESPATVLDLANRKCRHFEFGTIVTAICATSVPPYDEWQIASAGHLPPMIASPGEVPSLVELPVTPPLGTPGDFPRVEATVRLPDGAVLLIYTDGLVERRGESIDAGLDRLRAALHTGPPKDVCRRLLHDLVGSESPDDDVAIVALQRVAPRSDER